ncbi:hypothetical protein HDU96_009740 [Phlyctochytrium bullatum]|nr:hypothetical protein HDU96_009740 [Phlyctochytrium bullatum]
MSYSSNIHPGKDHRLAEFVTLVIHRIWSSQQAPPSPTSPPTSTTPAGCPPSPPPECGDKQSFEKASGAPFRPDSPNQRRLLEYVRRLLRCSSITTQAIVLALLFIARLRELNLRDPIREGAECDLFSTALLLAQKVLDDDRVDNVAWVDYAGVPLQTMNGMEREFLAKIRWQVFVSQAEYHEFIRKLKVIAEELPSAGNDASVSVSAPGPATARAPDSPPPEVEVYEATGCDDRVSVAGSRPTRQHLLQQQQLAQQQLHHHHHSYSDSSRQPHHHYYQQEYHHKLSAGYASQQRYDRESGRGVSAASMISNKPGFSPPYSSERVKRRLVGLPSAAIAPLRSTAAVGM